MSVSLRQGDSLEVMRSIESESVDMIFADPPFNVGKKYGGKSGNDNRQDYYEWCAAWIAEGFRVLKNTGSFYLMTIPRHVFKMGFEMEKHGIFVNQIMWQHSSAANDKRSFWNSYQPILFFGKSDERKFNLRAQRRPKSSMTLRWGNGYTTEPQGQVLDIWNDIPYVYSGSVISDEAILKPNSVQKAHPAQMPVNLAVRCIVFSTDEGDMVLDPFNGSGTTGEACIKLNRDFIGIEREAEYVQMANQRWDKARLSPSLFTPANNRLPLDVTGSPAQQALFAAEAEGAEDGAKQESEKK